MSACSKKKGCGSHIAKGIEKNALGNSGTASTMSNNLSANAGSLYGPLTNELTTQMVHPSGYTPAQKAAMNTAAQQSAGGSNAGTVGQGALYAARTRNAGAGQNAIAQGARQASTNLSDAALNTEMSNANLQQKQQGAATAGLESLYGTELGGSENALGLSNSALNTANSAAENNPWMKLALAGIQAGGQAAAGAGY